MRCHKLNKDFKQLLVTVVCNSWLYILIIAMALCCNLSCENEDIELNAILYLLIWLKTVDRSDSVIAICE